MKTNFDIVISGAGVVGATLAALLVRDGNPRDLSIAVLDAQLPPDFSADSPIGLRVSALSRASQRILSAAGAWPAISGARACPYREMRVWEALPDDSDDFRLAGVHFDSAELGEPDLGHIVENDVVRWSLHRVLAEHPGVNVIVPGRIAEISRDDGLLWLQLESGEALSASLLAGCDGPASRTREMAGIGSDSSGYGQQGVVAVVQTSLPHRETAWQRFLPGGPIAFLPLGSGESSIVWSCPDDKARALCALDDSAFSAAVGDASNHVLGDVEVRSARGAFPLRKMHARAYCADGVALAGDAAHVVHPLAGQGANLGLLDAACLAEVLWAAHANGEGLGDLRVLRRYERQRKGDNLAMQNALDGISRLFRSDVALAGRIRRGSLRAVNAAPPLKNRFVRHALGLAGELPRIAAEGMLPRRSVAAGPGVRGD